MAGMSKAQQVEAWNHEHPVGSKVVVTLDGNNEPFETTVKYAAEVRGTRMVAWVHGHAYAVDIGRITSYGGMEANAANQDELSKEDLNRADSKAARAGLEAWHLARGYSRLKE